MPPGTSTVSCGAAATFAGAQSYPTETVVTLGSGTGVVTLNFDAYYIPDRFIVVYDGATVIDTGYRGLAEYQSKASCAAASDRCSSTNGQNLISGIAAQATPNPGLPYTACSNATAVTNSKCTIVDNTNVNLLPAAFCNTSCAAVGWCTAVDGGSEPGPCDDGAGTASFTKTTASTSAYVYVYAPLVNTHWNFVLSCPAAAPPPPLAGRRLLRDATHEARYLSSPARAAALSVPANGDEPAAAAPAAPSTQPPAAAVAAAAAATLVLLAVVTCAASRARTWLASELASDAAFADAATADAAKPPPAVGAASAPPAADGAPLHPITEHGGGGGGGGAVGHFVMACWSHLSPGRGSPARWGHGSPGRASPRSSLPGTSAFPPPSPSRFGTASAHPSPARRSPARAAAGALAAVASVGAAPEPRRNGGAAAPPAAEAEAKPVPHPSPVRASPRRRPKPQHKA